MTIGQSDASKKKSSHQSLASFRLLKETTNLVYVNAGLTGILIGRTKARINPYLFKLNSDVNTVNVPADLAKEMYGKCVDKI